MLLFLYCYRTVDGVQTLVHGLGTSSVLGVSVGNLAFSALSDFRAAVAEIDRVSEVVDSALGVAYS